MARFKIIDIISLTNRGSVIVGDIIDNGSVSVGDFVSFQVNNATIDIQISSVEMVDYDNRKKAHLGLLISAEDGQRINDLNLKGIEIEVQKAIRGVDVALAASFGVGVKWWAGIVLLVIVGLLIWLYMTFIN